MYSTVYGEVEFYGIENGLEFPIMYVKSDSLLGSVSAQGLVLACYDGECTLFPSREQRNWSQFKVKKPKFDPRTLKPFDKVLVRDSDGCRWRCAFYSHTRNNCSCKYVTTDSFYEYCIPYNEETEHLVGKDDEAPEFYRYWEE